MALGAFFNDPFAPGSESKIAWGEYQIKVMPELRVSDVTEKSIIFNASKDPNARLAILRDANFSRPPGETVKAFCRSNQCSYSHYEGDAVEGAIANFKMDKNLQLVLIKPKAGNLWIEYKGPKEHFTTFETLINDIHTQSIEMEKTI